MERKIEFYSHFEEKGEYVWTTKELVIARELVEMGICRMAIILRGDPNSHVQWTLDPEPSASTNSVTSFTYRLLMISYW